MTKYQNILKASRRIWNGSNICKESESYDIKIYVVRSASKNPIKKVKIQPTEWEKIFVNHISDKALVIQNIQRTIMTQQKDKQPN